MKYVLSSLIIVGWVAVTICFLKDGMNSSYVYIGMSIIVAAQYVVNGLENKNDV